MALPGSPRRVFVDLPEPYGEREFGGVVAAIFGELDLRIEQLGQLFVSPGLLVELREVHDRFGLAGVFVEHAAQGFDGIVRSEVSACSSASSRRSALRSAESVATSMSRPRSFTSSRWLPCLSVELAQRGGRRGVGGRVLEDGLVKLDRARESSSLRCGDLRGLVLQSRELERRRWRDPLAARAA